MITKDSHHEVQCWSCHTTYLLPRALYVSAKASEHISFYCPYGHGAHYPAGESPEDKLRRERDRLAQQVAQRDDSIKTLQLMVDKANHEWGTLKAQQVRDRTRVKNGVCPCCNRTFAQLQRHMKSKHPTWKLFGEAA